MKLESNHGSSNGRYCVLYFSHFCKKDVNHFLSRKHDPERKSVSSQTYLFNSSYNIDLSTMVTRRFKIVHVFC